MEEEPMKIRTKMSCSPGRNDDRKSAVRAPRSRYTPPAVSPSFPSFHHHSIIIPSSQCAFCHGRRACGLPYGNTCIPDPLSYCPAAHPAVRPSPPRRRWRRRDESRRNQAPHSLKIPREESEPTDESVEVIPGAKCGTGNKQCALEGITYL